MSDANVSADGFDPSAEAASATTEESGVAAPQDGANEPPLTVEDIIVALEQTTAQRDEYLATAQRLQADFDNFRKRSAADAIVRLESGLGRLADALLPVLDACDAAVAHGDESVVAIRGQLMSVLEREGLERIEASGALFDPNLHDAVMHEAGDGGEPTVAEELRSGYAWKGKVLRAAMVKVKG